MAALLYLAYAFAAWLVLRLLGGLATLIFVGPSKSLWAWHRRFSRPGEPAYMDRWQLFRSPWLDVYVNRINRPDYDEHPHNHPWRRAWSVKLRGSYVEEVWSPNQSCDSGCTCGAHMYSITRTPPRFSRIPEVHRIVELLPNPDAHGSWGIDLTPVPCWTLFFGFGRAGGWGFVDPATGNLARKGSAP
jgi:hypothetical protein